MKTLFIFISVLFVSTVLNAQGSKKQMPMVFDPLTKKYFIGGNSHFALKEAGQNQLVERIEISIDGGEYHSYGDTIQFKEEGKHTIKFRATTAVNNWSPVQFAEVFVDMTPPTTEAKFPDTKYYKSDKETFVALNSKLSLSAQDNLSGVAKIEYSWDGKSFNEYSGPLDLQKLGPQSIYFRSSDRVGNEEPSKQIDFVVDGTAPTTTLKIGQNSRNIFLNGKNYFSDAAAFSIESMDDLSKIKNIWVSIDGAAFTPYLKPIYFLQEGPHSLKYYAEDFVSNKEPEKFMNIYTVSAPPQTELATSGKIVNTGGVNFATRDFQIKLTARDNSVGLERIEVKVDNDPDFKPYMEPLQFKTPGMHTVSYRAMDRVGNYEPSKTYNITIHDVGPETTISTAQALVVRNNVTYSPAPNIITFNVSNSAVGVEKTLYSINNSPMVPYQGPITLNSSEKNYKITYKSVDRLGNEESPKTMTFNMISAIPVLDLFISNGQSSEEQVRTNFLEQPAQPTRATEHAQPRKPASKKR